MTDKNLNYELAQFTGTEAYYRFNAFANAVLTDGTQYLAMEAEAFWLMDAIASHLALYQEGFAAVHFNQAEEGWKLALDDGNGNVFASQDIEYSTFPLTEITLFAAMSEQGWVIMLPSEY